MLDFNSFYTLSGIFVFLALVALMNGWFTVAGLLLTTAGSGGVGIFWERWSRMTGESVRITALIHPVRPTPGELELLASHLLLFLCGVTVLGVMAWRRASERRLS